MNKQSFLEDDKFEEFSTLDLIEIVDNDLLLERARAIFFLQKGDKQTKKLFQRLL